MVKTPRSTAFAVHAITGNSTAKPRDNIAVTFTWEKLGQGSYKLNTDASFFENGVGAIAAIIRNCRGEAVAGVAEPFTYADSATTAEALALRRGLQLVNHICCFRVTVESDCFEIISACRGEADILAPYSAILADCFRYAHDIASIQFQHCPREANGLAHFLARHAFYSNLVFSWDDDPPSFLLPHVLKNVILINS